MRILIIISLVLFGCDVVETSSTTVVGGGTSEDQTNARGAEGETGKTSGDSEIVTGYMVGAEGVASQIKDGVIYIDGSEVVLENTAANKVFVYAGEPSAFANLDSNQDVIEVSPLVYLGEVAVTNAGGFITQLNLDDFSGALLISANKFSGKNGLLAKKPGNGLSGIVIDAHRQLSGKSDFAAADPTQCIYKKEPTCDLLGVPDGGSSRGSGLPPP